MDQSTSRELVEGILGIMEKRLVRIVLYGSVARGTDTDESDIDIALLVRGKLESEIEDKLLDLVVDMNLKYDKVFSVIDIDYDFFCEWEAVTPFYKNVNREGVVLWQAA